MANELVLTGITKTYPGVTALDDVSISFNKGEIHALIGENGAGKSTFIKVLSGGVRPDCGTIEINGKVFHEMSPSLAIKEGIAVVHQELMQFDALTVAENICMSDMTNGFFLDRKAMKEKARKVLDAFDAHISTDALIRDLSMANRQIVEIAKAVNQNAQVVIMDEPTAAITVQEQEKLFYIVKRLKEEGKIVIYISHRLAEITEMCDRATVLRDAKKIGTYPLSELSTKKMVSLMVGRSIDKLYPEKPPCGSEVVLSVKNLTGNGVENISFELHKSEILGFAGLVGAGRTETMELIFGVKPYDSGEILLKGKPADIKNPTDAIDKGIGFITEERKLTGLFLEKSILWNTTIITAKKFSKMLMLSKQKEQKEAERFKESLNIKAPNLDTLTASLSGGNQQKVVLAKVLSADSDIIIFDEPTRGVDIGARSEIYQLMVELTKQGKSILMVTSDMEELIGMSERIVVLHEGQLMGEVHKPYTQDKIMELASGIKEEESE